MKHQFKVAIILTTIIVAVSVGGYYYLREKVYPRPYKEEVFSLSQKYDVSPSIIYAIIKAESGFKSNAISKKSAKGLMQLTDSTAEYVAEMLGITEYDVLDVSTNLELGVYYFRYLMLKFDRIEEALCAYNAGEGNVSEWLLDKKFSKDGKRLKKVPYKETAIYVTKVKKYAKVYRNIIKR